MSKFKTEEQAQDLLRQWQIDNYPTQAKAAKKVGTSTAHFGHVVNYRKALTKKMQKAVGLEREVVIRYKAK